MKKIVCFLALISSIFLIDTVKAEELKKDNVENGTYIIGTHIFNREQNDNYDGTLKIEHIMLASRTIEEYDLENMKIYYKNARGKWVNPVNNEVLESEEIPTTFEINYKNLNMKDLDFNSPNLSMTTLNDINQDDIVGCVANKDNTFTCHFDLKLNNDKVLSDSKEIGYEIYSVDADGDEYKYTLLDSKKVTNSNEIYNYSKVFNLGDKSTVVARAYVKNANNEKVYSGYSNLVSVNIPKVGSPAEAAQWSYTAPINVSEVGIWYTLDRNSNFVDNYDAVEVYRSKTENGEYTLEASKGYFDLLPEMNGESFLMLISALKANEGYYYKVRSYKTINGEKFYSEYSEPKYFENIVPTIELVNVGVNSVGPQPGENTYYTKINLSNSSAEYDNITFYGSTSENGQYHKIKSYTNQEVNDLKDNGFLIELPLENYYYIKAGFDNNGYSTVMDLRNQTIPAPGSLNYVYTQKSENGEYKVGNFSFDNMYDVDGGEVYVSTSINGNYEKVGSMTDFYSTGLYYKFRSYIVIDGTEEKIYSKFTEPFYIDEKYIVEETWLELIKEENFEPYDGRITVTLQTNVVSDDNISVELHEYNLNGVGGVGGNTYRVTDNVSTFIIPKGAKHEYYVSVCKDIDGIMACGENSNTINIENNNISVLGSVGAYEPYKNLAEVYFTNLMPDVDLYDGIEIWYSEDEKNYNLFEKIKKEDIDYLEEDPNGEDFNFIIGEKTPLGKTYYYKIRYYKEYSSETVYSKFSYTVKIDNNPEILGEVLDTVSKKVTYGGTERDLSLIFSYEYEEDAANAYVTVLLDGKLVDFSSTNYVLADNAEGLTETEFVKRILNSVNNIEITTMKDTEKEDYDYLLLELEYSSSGDEFTFDKVIMIFDQDKMLAKYQNLISAVLYIEDESYENLDFKNNAIYYFENHNSEILYEYKITNREVVEKEIPIPEDAGYTGGA